MDDDLINGWWTAEEALREHPDLVGAALVWREYERPSESWDHDHCAFCWATVTDIPNPSPDDLPAAYTDDMPRPASPPLSDPELVSAPAGTKNWICPVCAQAFRPVFGWTTSGGPGALVAPLTLTPTSIYHQPVSREQSTAAIDRFRVSCANHPLVVAAFLGGSYAAGSARPDSDIDLYVITRPEDYSTFLAERKRFIQSLGNPTQLEDIWNFEGLGFDMTAFTMSDGVYGEVAYGTTTNFLKLHGGPHEVLVDKTNLLDGVTFPLL